ncbi:hypothetical protein PHYSODRAFT_330295 [Phytophthora sojae]|uniref:Uncharacterized protein n=1 Tax=Phytophthora sojae (strain P6497) TaxID=1094619 RepID=G4Z7Y6_PHYSP|nr:hypothetical protein PHYSODRAFT_330295 [Phytophthora sojae]EGZ22521.1 hypothetical protein PHYSODRAFT_330295 [Phytophthora sojae]|eukprot:XP_009525238.1 hypothetical protein PHYSODRAFT_330295 [Phytophthora sojae]
MAGAGRPGGRVGLAEQQNDEDHVDDDVESAQAEEPAFGRGRQGIPGDNLRSDHLMLDNDGEGATAAIWGTVLGKNAAHTPHEQDQDINNPLPSSAPELFEKQFNIDASRVGLRRTRCAQCVGSCSTDAAILDGEKMKSYMIENLDSDHFERMMKGVRTDKNVLSVAVVSTDTYANYGDRLPYILIGDGEGHDSAVRRMRAGERESP